MTKLQSVRGPTLVLGNHPYRSERTKTDVHCDELKELRIAGDLLQKRTVEVRHKPVAGRLYAKDEGWMGIDWDNEMTDRINADVPEPSRQPLAVRLPARLSIGVPSGARFHSTTLLE